MYQMFSPLFGGFCFSPNSVLCAPITRHSPPPGYLKLSVVGENHRRDPRPVVLGEQPLIGQEFDDNGVAKPEPRRR